MYLLAPLSKFEEVEPLLDAGADEFYCGFIPSDSNMKYINCHAGNETINFKSYDILKRASSIIHSRHKKLFVVLNMPSINEKQYPFIQEIILELLKIKIDAVIVSDVGLIFYLREKNPSLEIHLSTVAGLFNGYALDFAREIGVKRVILPDHLSLSEIKEINKKKENLVFEVFVLNNRCSNLESFCAFHHRTDTKKENAAFSKSVIRTMSIDRIKKILKKLPQRFVRKFLNSRICVKIFEEMLSSQQQLFACKLNYEVKPFKASYNKIDIENAQKIKKTFGPYAVFNRMNQCGACGMYKASVYGVEAVKVDGRFLPKEKKIRDVQFIRSCLNYVNCANNQVDFIRHCKTVFEKKFGYRCSVEHCYYPDLWKVA